MSPECRRSRMLWCLWCVFCLFVVVIRRCYTEDFEGAWSRSAIWRRYVSLLYNPLTTSFWTRYISILKVQHRLPVLDRNRLLTLIRGHEAQDAGYVIPSPLPYPFYETQTLSLASKSDTPCTAKHPNATFLLLSPSSPRRTIWMCTTTAVQFWNMQTRISWFGSTIRRHTRIDCLTLWTCLRGVCLSLGRRVRPFVLFFVLRSCLLCSPHPPWFSLDFFFFSFFWPIWPHAYR